MSGQDINGSVQRGEGWLSGNFGKTTVVRNKVDHLLLHVLAEFFHPVRTLSESRGQVHVLAYLLGILIVLVNKSPVLREFVRCHLLWDLNSGRGGSRNSKQECSDRRGCSLLHEVPALQLRDFLRSYILLFFDRLLLLFIIKNTFFWQRMNSQWLS